MRIALITPHFQPRFEGGTEAVARAQAQGLLERGHDVRIVSGCDSPRSGDDVERTEVDGLPVAFVPRTLSEPYDLTLERPRVLELLRAEVQGVDIVHLHHWATLDGGLVRALAADVPVVLTLHDLFVTCPRFFRVPVLVERCPPRGDVAPCVTCISRDAPGHAPDALAAGLRQRADGFEAELAAAGAVIVPSRAHRTSIEALVNVDPARVHVVPHGRLFAAARPAGTALVWDGSGPLRVLHPGNRAAVKGGRDLVRALAALPPEQRARVELVFLGAEVEPGFDAALRAEAAGVSLRFEPPYAAAELPARVAELGGFHLAALPSRVAESYGLVLDEAHGLGLPAWVSDRGAPPERVGDAGRVLPAEDARAWTREFADILAQPEHLERERLAVPDHPRTAADAARELEALYVMLGAST